MKKKLLRCALMPRGRPQRHARGHARPLSSGFLLMLKRCRDSSISTALRYVLDCDSTMFRLRDHCVSPCRGADGEGRGRAISR